VTIREFLYWWRNQLLELMPATLRRSWQGAKTTLILGIDGSTVTLRSPSLDTRTSCDLPNDTQTIRPASVDKFLSRLPRPERLLLQLAPNEYLLRRLTLPRAAQANLAEAVGYQLPQLTPFTASQLVYACGETGDSPPDGPISVWLVAVPRQRIERALALIDQTPPDGYLPLRQPPQPGEPLELSWRLQGASSHSQQRMRLAWLGLVVLGCGVLGLHLYHQHQAQTELDKILDELRVRVPRVGELRDRLTAAEAQAAKLARLRQSTPSALTVLEVLSEQLDDQTWLQGFDLRDGRLTLRGISESPATLIETLEDTEVLRDVRFGSAITRDGRSEGDRFNLSARVEPAVREGGS
jgi:general secretion pathway protein L